MGSMGCIWCIFMYIINYVYMYSLARFIHLANHQNFGEMLDIEGMVNSKLLYFEWCPPWHNIQTFFLAVYLTSILTFCLKFYLTYIQTFFLAVYLASNLTFYLTCVRVQAHSTASGAGDVVFGSRRDPLHPELAEGMKATKRREEEEEEGVRNCTFVKNLQVA